MQGHGAILARRRHVRVYAVSWDVCCTIDAGGPEPAGLDGLDENYTYNCAPMFDEAAGMEFSELNGCPASEVARIIGTALVRMREDRPKYEAMNPSNGWGSYETFVQFLEKIADFCRRHPRATLRVT